MENIIEYIKKSGWQSFEEKSFNEVDSLILCQLSYLNYERFVPGVEKEACRSVFKASISILTGTELWMITGTGKTIRSFFQQRQSRKDSVLLK